MIKKDFASELAFFSTIEISFIRLLGKLKEPWHMNENDSDLFLGDFAYFSFEEGRLLKEMQLESIAYGDFNLGEINHSLDDIWKTGNHILAGMQNTIGKKEKDETKYFTLEILVFSNVSKGVFFEVTRGLEEFARLGIAKKKTFMLHEYNEVAELMKTFVEKIQTSTMN